MFNSRLMYFTIVVVSMLCHTGCEMFQPMVSNSFDKEGEVVHLQMITWQQAASDDRFKGLDWRNVKPPPIIPELADNGDRFLDVGALAAKLVDVGLNWAAARAKQEAAKYEAQYKQTIYDDSFWDNGVPKYAGFELVRTSKAFPDSASRLVFQFEYAKSDPRMVLIRPIYYTVNAAKAKVAKVQGDARLATSVNIMVTGAWLDNKGALQEQQLANASYALRNLQFDETPNDFSDLANKHVFGYFRAPPISAGIAEDESRAFTNALRDLKDARAKLAAAQNPTDEQKKAKADATQLAEDSRTAVLNAWNGGAFRLSIVVTESDESKVKDYLIRFSDMITERKPAIIEAVMDATGQ